MSRFLGSNTNCCSGNNITQVGTQYYTVPPSDSCSDSDSDSDTETPPPSKHRPSCPPPASAPPPCPTNSTCGPAVGTNIATTGTPVIGEEAGWFRMAFSGVVTHAVNIISPSVPSTIRPAWAKKVVQGSQVSLMWETFSVSSSAGMIGSHCIFPHSASGLLPLNAVNPGTVVANTPGTGGVPSTFQLLVHNVPVSTDPHAFTDGPPFVQHYLIHIQIGNSSRTGLAQVCPAGTSSQRLGHLRIFLDINMISTTPTLINVDRVIVFGTTIHWLTGSTPGPN